MRNLLVTTPWRHVWVWRYTSVFLNLSTRQRWVASFKPLPLYSQYPLARRMGGPHGQSGRCAGNSPSVIRCRFRILRLWLKIFRALGHPVKTFVCNECEMCLESPHCDKRYYLIHTWISLELLENLVFVTGSDWPFLNASSRCRLRLASWTLLSSK
jgi:hypothetical protein